MSTWLGSLFPTTIEEDFSFTFSGPGKLVDYFQSPSHITGSRPQGVSALGGVSFAAGMGRKVPLKLDPAELGPEPEQP